MSVEKAKEILKKPVVELPDDRRKLMYPLSRVMVAVDKALAELEATPQENQSKPPLLAAEETIGRIFDRDKSESYHCKECEEIGPVHVCNPKQESREFTKLARAEAHNASLYADERKELRGQLAAKQQLERTVVDLEDQLGDTIKRAEAAESDWQIAEEQLAAKDKEIKRLRESLKEYGGHDIECASQMEEDEPCICGFEEALKGKE